MNQNATRQILPDPSLEERERQLIAQTLEQDKLGKLAVGVPFPGPARDAFAIPQDIVVDKWKVRPFYGLDFRLLQSMNHPFHKQLVAEMAGEKAEQVLPYESDGFKLYWIFTRDPKDVREFVTRNGLEAVEAAAEEEFGRLQLPALIKLYEAIIRQFAVFTGTVVTFGEPSEEGQEEAKAENPFASTGQPSTATAG